MKKITLTTVVMLVLILLLAACGQQTAPTETSDPTTQTTVATQPTQATEPSTEAAQPSVQELQLPQEGTPLTESELDWYRRMFSIDQDPYAAQPINWYNLMLSIQFDAPENINLRELFYHGTRWNADDLTEEETKLLQAAGYNTNLDRVRIDPAEAEEVLQYFFGLTWEETNRVGEDKLFYMAETGCYYKAASDSLFLPDQWLNILGGAVMEDGTVRLYHQRQGDGQIYVITLQSKRSLGETGYYVLSNLPVE